MLTPDEKSTLLRIAREAIGAHLTGTRAELPPLEGVAAERRGAFVTLHKRGDLRGCIGHIEADMLLGQVVARCAVSAATSDPRFDAVTSSELADMDLEVSVLGPLVPVNSIDEIEVGRHGLVVEQGWHRGLLLPQVATEWGWDREAFVAQTCRKAGLPLDAWQRGARLWKFEAEVFSEHDGAA
jgi:AmmeMemoRadiSam system protein A